MNRAPLPPSARFPEFLQECRQIVGFADPLETRGRLTRSAGLVMEVVGLKLPVGARVAIVQADTAGLDAEVAGFAGERLFLMPTSEPQGIRPGATAIPFEPAAARPHLGKRNRNSQQQQQPGCLRARWGCACPGRVARRPVQRVVGGGAWADALRFAGGHQEQALRGKAGDLGVDCRAVSA